MLRFSALFCFFFTQIVNAQSVNISGRCVGKKEAPLANVMVTCQKCENKTVYTNSKGIFELNATFLDTIQIELLISDFKEKRTIIVSQLKFQRLPDIRFPILEVDAITIQHKVNDPTDITLKKIDYQKLTFTEIEKFLVFSTAARSNNELTSNYNVRGGNFDENLVYVNGFQVYRPFLTRSGQQEGMSFINTALVDNIRFSGGGFDANYGDKLSSVLDIDYKNPNQFKSSAMASLLGVEAHVEQSPSTRFNYLAAARYRSNGYFLNSLPTKGTYNPVFWDAQFLTNYAITENLTWSILGHFSSNNYRFSPQTAETDFGTANEAYSFKVYFEGQEQTRFLTMMGGTSLKWKPNKRTKLDLYATVFNTNEKEYFDVLGEYFINQLETDPSKEEYGDSIAVLGIGGFLSHARNKLNANIYNFYHNGSYILQNKHLNTNQTKHLRQEIDWGANFELDQVYDIISEWKMVDSAGYSFPQNNDNQVDLFETIKSELNMNTYRVSSFLQWRATISNSKKLFPISISTKTKKDNIKIVKTFFDTIENSTSRWIFKAGIRQNFTEINHELFFTPRLSVTYNPRVYMVQNGKISKRDLNVFLNTGLYYQPPFYREFRTFDGGLNFNVKSQKSFHLVGGSSIYFNMWQRKVPFKFTAEAFYKYMWDVNPYEVENVRTRYYADNLARAYAYGIDLNVNGQFVDGIESFFKVGFLSTKEDLYNDSYTAYYNATGERIIFGVSEDQTITDSTLIYPGYIPRPTDQLLNIGALVQDRMPGIENFTVQMGLQFGTRLPYGPPDFNRYKDTLRMKSYFRVDIGLSYDFLYKSKMKNQQKGRFFQDAILSFEVFNLLGINNVMSKQWIQDTEGKYYSIPNYLTQRRFNLKLILRY